MTRSGSSLWKSLWKLLWLYLELDFRQQGSGSRYLCRPHFLYCCRLYRDLKNLLSWGSSSRLRFRLRYRFRLNCLPRCLSWGLTNRRNSDVSLP